MNRLRPSSVPFGFLSGLMLLACAGGGAGSGPEPAAPSGSPEAAPGATEPAASPPQIRREHGASVFAVHQVKDFDAFMKFFEEGTAARTEQGVEGQLVSRLDDGRVVIHFFAKNLDQVDAALKSKDMDSYLAREGAPDASLVWLAHDQLVVLPATPPKVDTFSLLMKLPVTDFAAFKRGFEERLQVFATEDVIGEGLHQSSADENVAILHFVGTDRAALEALPKSPAFVELLKIAGTDPVLKPLLAVDVSRSRPQ